MVSYLRRSAAQVALAVAIGAVPALLLTLLEVRAGSQTPVTDFAAYFHPFLSFALVVLIGRQVFIRREAKSDVVILLVMLFATMAASPKRVPPALYPFTTLVLLGVITYALASLMKAEKAGERTPR